jgi:hypothetical protein
MRTVRRALKDLVSMGAVVVFGGPTADSGSDSGSDVEPERRGAAWLLIQVAAAAVVLGLALAVWFALGGVTGTVPLWIWVVPGMLLVVPFIGHVFARPSRLMAGAAAAIVWVVVVGLAGSLWAPPIATVPLLYGTAAVAALGAAAVLGGLSPAVPESMRSRR